MRNTHQRLRANPALTANLKLYIPNTTKYQVPKSSNLQTPVKVVIYIQACTIFEPATQPVCSTLLLLLLFWSGIFEPCKNLQNVLFNPFYIVITTWLKSEVRAAGPDGFFCGRFDHFDFHHGFDVLGWEGVAITWIIPPIGIAVIILTWSILAESGTDFIGNHQVGIKAVLISS